MAPGPDPAPHAPGGPTRRAVLAGLAATASVTAIAPATSLAQLATTTSRTGRASLPATITVNRSATLGRIGPRFMGLSIERDKLGVPLFSDTNTGFVELLRRLGAGQLRLGGNSVETSPWDALGSGTTFGSVAPSDVDRLRGFLDATGWTTLYGTPFATTDAATVAAETAVVAPILGATLDGFELANEPDLYRFVPGYSTFDQPLEWFARWQTFVDAIRVTSPDVAFAGSASAVLGSLDNWLLRFANLAEDTASILTQHYYRGHGLGPQTIDVLLAPDPNLVTNLPRIHNAAVAHGMTWRLGETNTFALGGQPGVSNAFASALWAIGLWFEAGRNDAAGVNFHNSGNGPGYPAIAQLNGVVTEVRPLYYGLLLLAAVGAGPIRPASAQPTGDTLRVHVVEQDPATLRVVLVNVSPTDEFVATVDCGTAVLTADAQRLTAPSLDATTGTTFAGATVGVDGSWSPLPAEPLTTAGDTFSVTVAPASAVLVRAGVVPVPPPTTSTSTTTTALPRSTTTAPPSTNAPGDPSAAPATPIVAAANFTG